MNIETLMDPNNKLKYYINYITNSINSGGLNPFYSVIIICDFFNLL
jgi:hypothetical protein